MAPIQPFFRKSQALVCISQNPGTELFAVDKNAHDGSKEWLVSNKTEIFNAIYGNDADFHPVSRAYPSPKKNRALYECFEKDTPVALIIDLDLPCDDPLDDCRAVLWDNPMV